MTQKSGYLTQKSCVQPGLLWFAFWAVVEIVGLAICFRCFAGDVTLTVRPNQTNDFELFDRFGYRNFSALSNACPVAVTLCFTNAAPRTIYCAAQLHVVSNGWRMDLADWRVTGSTTQDCWTHGVPWAQCFYWVQ